MSPSQRLFQLILFAYPRAFRRLYGPQMVQVFRDCHRHETKNSGRLGVSRLWIRTLLDVGRTVPEEHWDNLRKDNWTMKSLRTDAMALLGCIGIIVIAFWLLSYGRTHQVTSLLALGYALDAIVASGIVGNLIVFLLVKTTRFNPLRTALWSLLIVNGALLLTAIIIGSRVEPPFPLGSVLISYIVSFLFWFGLHWLWALRKDSLDSAT